MLLNNIIIILFSLVFSAFFSGMEIAFISANKLRIELDKKSNRFPSGIISIFIKNPGQYIATMLVGNNIALVVYGFFMAKLLTPVILMITTTDIWVLILQTIISTSIILLTAEFLPKTLFRINPNFALNIFALPVYLFYIIFFPISMFTMWLSNSLLKKIFRVDLLKEKERNNKVAFGRVDLDHFLAENNPGPEQEEEIEHDVKIFQNALDFSTIKLRECIVPRTEIIALDVNQNIEELRQKFIETGFSKILIYEGTIDNIIGYFHNSDLFKNPKTIESKLNKLIIVPDTMSANKLLSMFTTENKSIALVVDEFGGTAGIVTMEDIIEEIFGEIEDEHDISGREEKQISENEFIFSARLEIDYVNEKYKLNLPVTDEYETIAGFILYYYESFPKLNETIIIDKFTFKIKKASETRIELVSLSTD